MLETFAILKQVQGDIPRSVLSFIVCNFLPATGWKRAQRNSQHLHANISCYLEAILKQVQGDIPKSVLSFIVCYFVLAICLKIAQRN